MAVDITLGWGQKPRQIRVPEHAIEVQSPRLVGHGELKTLLSAAVAEPIGMPPLAEVLKGCRSVCVLIPDETRKDVAAELLPLLMPLLGDIEVSIGVASGKHPVRAEPVGRWRHDAQATTLRSVGTTTRGTPVAFPPSVLDADLRICLGEIRPHYFAGYAGGAKTLFPGVAGADGIWKNHTLKAAPGARLGQIDGNPCRDDMEEAAQRAGPSFMINVIRGHDGRIAHVIAGHLIDAHRFGVGLARPYFEVSMQSTFQTVVISDRLPVSMNLYQACKLLPPAGAILEDGGTVILAAECTDGIGPVKTINEAIYGLGSVHSLPARHRVILVSRHSEADVAPTFAEFSPDFDAALSRCQLDRLAVIPFGGDLVPRLSSSVGGNG